MPTKKRTKKLNPRRIPMPKNMIDKEAILEEATRDDLYRAWLLVFHSLLEMDRVEVDGIPSVTDDVNRYLQSASFRGQNKDNEITKAEKIMGFSSPYENLRPDEIKSLVELERFKQKVYKIATHTALCVICLGLAAGKRFSEEDLRQIFFNVDLTISEIDRGRNSYARLESEMAALGIVIERENDEFHQVSIVHQEQQ